MSLALAVVVFVFFPFSAPAQTYPTKPITLIVPFPAGTGNDVIARTIGDKLSKSLGKPVVVENKAGATGAIAAEATKQAPADGYTIFIPSTSLSINMSVNKVSYDLVKDFSPAALVGIMPNALVVPASLKINSIKELIELAKSKPGQINFASNGFGGVAHLLAEMFKMASGINIVHVAYKGANEAFADLLTGRVQMMFSPLTTVFPLIKDGNLKVLGICSDKRSPALADEPIMGELGYPTLEIPNWYAIMAPAATPQPVIAKLNAEITKIMAMPDVKELLANVGVEPRSSTPEVAAAYIKQDVGKWSKVIKDAHVQMK
jgi:tripartite-type tricarboxylate transporter receptor subunit TctC